MHMAGGDAAAAQRDADIERLQTEFRSVRDVLAAIHSQNAVNTPTVNTLRERQRIFYRQNQRFPQFIDVGIRVWELMQDWHIAHQRPLTIQPAGEGRFMMEFLMTVLVLKHELGENEIGQPYDRQ